MNPAGIDRQKRRMIGETVLVMLLWGTLFPAVKLGYAAFSIDTAFYPNLLLFAGLRFLVSGGILTLVCALRHEPMRIGGRKERSMVLLVGLFAICLHYACTYIGLSVTDSSKTALLKQLGALFFVCFSFLFFREDRFSVGRVLSALLGLAGIFVLNTDGFGFSFGIGEALIVAASVCTVISGILCKKYTAGIPPMVVTAYSQLSGGAVLTAASLLMGGKPGTVSAESLSVFLYLCLATCVSYVLWNKNVQRGTLSDLFILKFLEPLFASVTGALLLGEDILRLEYLLAFLLIAAAILLSEGKRKKD